MTPNTAGRIYQLLRYRLIPGEGFRIPTHVLVAGSAWVSRILIAGVQLGTIRILTSGLGLEQYAMFALLTGLLGWYLLFDFGIGVSTQNRISECRAHGLSYDVYVLAAVLCALFFLVVSIFGLYLASPYLAPKFLKGFSDISDAEKTKNFFVTGALFIGMGIGTISYKIWYAEHRGYLAHLLPAAASVIGFLGIVVTSRMDGGNRLYLCLVASNAPPALLPLFSLLTQVSRRSGCLARIDRHIMKAILSRAVSFWLFALIGTAVVQTDYIVISQVLQPDEIAAYVLSTKIFGFILFFYISMLWALRPDFTEAISRGEWELVKRSLGRCIKLGMIFVAGSTGVLIAAMPFIVKVMAPGQAIEITALLCLLLGVYQLVQVWTNVYSAILQSMNSLRAMWVLVPVQALICVGLQYLLAPIYGVYGIVLGLIGSFLSTVVWGLPLAVNKEIRKSQIRLSQL